MPSALTPAPWSGSQREWFINLQWPGSEASASVSWRVDIPLSSVEWKLAGSIVGESISTSSSQVRKSQLALAAGKHWDGASVLKGHVMRLSSKFVAPSALAFLSSVLLCNPAASQTATGAAAPLPSVTVEAPKQAARPKQVVNTGISRRTSSTGHTRSATAQRSTARTASAAPESPLARIARLEKVASSCNGGCATSFPVGKEPWVGCSEAGAGETSGHFSSTCRDTITHRNYVECVETKVFLGDYRNRAYWFCSGLSAGNRFKVAEIKQSGRR